MMSCPQELRTCPALSREAEDLMIMTLKLLHVRVIFTKNIYRDDGGKVEQRE